MVTYFCRRCSFKYTPKIPRTSPPARCQNCGGAGSVEREPDAEEIIRMSDKMV